MSHRRVKLNKISFELKKFHSNNILIFILHQLSTDAGLNTESFGSKTHLGWSYYPRKMTSDRIMFVNVDFNVTDADQGDITYYETTDVTSDIVTFASDEVTRFLGQPFKANHVFVVNYDQIQTAKATIKVSWLLPLNSTTEGCIARWNDAVFGLFVATKILVTNPDTI